MNALVELGIIGGAALAAAGGTLLVIGAPDRSPPPLVCNPSELKPDELCLADVIARGVESFVWIDARRRSEWQADGYPGSLLWSLEAGEDLNALAAEAAPRLFGTPQAIVYCGDENCGLSRQVAGQIRDLGLGTDVFVLYGGWRALSEAGMLAVPK